MEEYTNQSLYIMLKGIRDDVVEIKEQVKKINGRVRKNENKISAIFAVGGVITTVILPIVFYFLFQ